MTNIAADLKRTANELLSQFSVGKKYIIGQVSERLRRAAEDNPQDTVIKAVASIIEKKSQEDPGRFISQADMDKIYNEVVGLNVSGTRFREILGDLLKSEGPKSVEPNSKFADENRDPFQDALEETDPVLRHELGNIFEPKSDIYDPSAISQAREMAEMELRSLGHKNVRVNVAGGNSRHIICSADLDTSRGSVRVYIPLETSGKLPSVFVAGNRFDELTRSNLEKYLNESSISRKPLPAVKSILHSLDILTGVDHQRKTAAEALSTEIHSKLPEENGSGSLSSSNLFADVPKDITLSDVEIPKTPVPEPLRAIVSDVEENLAEAGLNYSPVSIRMAKRMVLAELASWGFKGAQVKVSSSTHDGFICEAALNMPRGKVNINIPIEMKNGNPLIPSVFTKGDLVGDFNEASLKESLAKGYDIVPVAIRSDSPLMSKSAAELNDMLVKSAVSCDYKACDEVLEIIAGRFGADTYRNALADYQKILTSASDAKTASTKCSRVIRSPNSIHPLCGHFMTPLNKVVQDERGNCHLASTYYSRKNQDDEGAFFSNSKVLVGD
jgi:hypothetical protein